ncbi:M15 family metallopeptidase [Mesorhizobium sp.]|uniref:M15 family metallopeptidase n=1 Tax=Mesorhizobium sp. TaxID=1871066 RepID=UPI0025794CE8|nr:M15 family metallopeptidase [Mesorhizobium sp.]
MPTRVFAACFVGALALVDTAKPSAAQEAPPTKVLMLPEPVDHIFPGGSSAFVTISTQGREIQLIDAASSDLRASSKLVGQPVSFASREDTGTGLREFAILTRSGPGVTGGPYELAVIEATPEGFRQRWSRADAVPAEFGQPAVRFVQGGSVIVWDRALDQNSSFYQILGPEPTTKDKNFAKLYPYELLNVRSADHMLALHPRDDGASLMNLRGGWPEDNIFVGGLSFRDPANFAVFAPASVFGGTGDAIIANGDAALLTVLSVQVARVARIGSPNQISLENIGAIAAGKRQLLVAADRDLSFILVGAVGSNLLNVFRRIGAGASGEGSVSGGLEEVKPPIVLDAPISDMTAIGTPGSSSDTFAFLREDGREIRIVPEISALQHRQPTDPELTTIAFTSTHLDAADVARLQRVLANLGFPVGEIDGVIGANTTAAIRAFQVASGLEVTGVTNGMIDQPTIDALNPAVNKLVNKIQFGSIDAKYLEDYKAFLDEQANGAGVNAARLLTLGVSHENPGSPCFKLNSLPPRELWRNSAGFAKILKRLQDGFKFNVEIVSGYRNAAYGSCVAGRDVGSTHLAFQAFDIRLANTETFRESNSRLLTALREMRDAGEFKGGLGIGGHSVHVDTRGTNADFGLLAE